MCRTDFESNANYFLVIKIRFFGTEFRKHLAKSNRIRTKFEPNRKLILILIQIRFDFNLIIGAFEIRIQFGKFAKS